MIRIKNGCVVPMYVVTMKSHRAAALVTQHSRNGKNPSHEKFISP